MTFIVPVVVLTATFNKPRRGSSVSPYFVVFQMLEGRQEDSRDEEQTTFVSITNMILYWLGSTHLWKVVHSLGNPPIVVPPATENPS
jgi:hypothetical protein